MDSLGFAAWLKDYEIEEFNEPELKEHNDGEKEIICPHCGGKILI